MQEETRRKMLDAFALLFLLSHRFEYVADNELQKDELTTKQFLAIVAIEKGFVHPPSIGEVASVLSTTHQNVKQIALQLEKKGFVIIERDQQDKRKLVLKVTEKNKQYWNSTAQRHEATIRSLFSPLTEEEIHSFYELVTKLLVNLDNVYSGSKTL